MSTTLEIVGKPIHKTRMVVCIEDSCIFKRDSIKLEVMENANGILVLKCPMCGHTETLVKDNWDLREYNN